MTQETELQAPSSLSASDDRTLLPPAENDVLAHVQALSGARVLCVGDVMLDRFVHGRVERVSPEAPIPVLRVEEEVTMLGGSGNVVRNLVALGTRVWFVSVVGADDAGHEITKLVGREKGVEPHLTVEPNRKTTVKERFVAGGQQLLRADRETSGALGPLNADTIVGLASSVMEEIDILVLSDYNKGTLTSDVTSRLIETARERGIRTVCDPKGRDYRKYSGCDLLTPNRRELAEATGLPAGTRDEVIGAARQLIRSCGIGAVLATLSDEGMIHVTATEARHVPAEAREVFDVSGAGDTVIATMAASLAAGLDISAAISMANAAAGIVVGKTGTAVVHAAELSRYMRQHMDHSDGKVVMLENLLQDVARWRAAGLKVGFTNGCFDLIHPGHVSLLRQARAACDRLIVGLNTDASVRGLKGSGRPVQDELSRAEVLAAIGTVDRVVLFSEDTPIRLLEAIRPDVLVKGADYTVETVVGSDLILAAGGEVLLADLTPGKSTTSMVEKMASTA